MNWNAKERSEIALNKIWSEHVRSPPAPSPHTGRSRLRRPARERPPVIARGSQVEKEKNFIKPKTVYTCNPCSSIAMNNGLGSRGAHALCRRPAPCEAAR